MDCLRSGTRLPLGYVGFDEVAAAGILVMGHRTGGGISVYQFDADKLTLDRAWVVD